MTRTRPTRLFLSTGEVSGDLQGALLVEALHRQARDRGLDLEIAALGGERMAAAGATVLADTTRIGSVGLVEALPFVLPTWRVQRRIRQALRSRPPEALVFIDYAGPNGSLGQFAQRHLPNVPRIYYIAPQVYVWSGIASAQQLAERMDYLLAIFPREAEFFRERGVAANWVGHPIADRIQAAPSRDRARAALGIAPEETAIALLPASRRQEIAHLLPAICAAAARIQAQVPDVRFWVPLSDESFRAAIAAALDAYELRATVLCGRTSEAIAAADVAIAKSGTVNLETAYLDVPQVVLYRVSPVTAWLGRNVLRFSIPFMSPPNLVLMEAIVPELLQEAATPERVASEAIALLSGPRREKVRAGYARIRAALGGPGASDRAAAALLGYLESGCYL